MCARNHSQPSNSLLSYSQQEAKEKEEAESRIKVKREAEKVAVMQGSYHNERRRFCSFSFKITHEITENLCERTQGSFSPGVDILFLKGQKEIFQGVTQILNFAVVALKKPEIICKQMGMAVFQ